MNWILIVVLMSITNPTQPARLGHHGFNTQEECFIAADVYIKKEKEHTDLKIMPFCVETKDLLTNEK